MSLSGTRSRGLNRVKVRESRLARYALRGLLILVIEFRENGDLDGTGLREDFVLTEKERLAGGEVFDGNPHYAVKFSIDLVNGGFELVP